MVALSGMSCQQASNGLIEDRLDSNLLIAKKRSDGWLGGAGKISDGMKS